MISNSQLPNTFSTLAKRFAQRIAPRLPVWITLLLAAAALANGVGLALGGLPGWMVNALDRLSGMSAVFLGIVIEAAPFLLLGTLASGIVEAFVDRDALARWLPRGVLPGALAGSLIGLFFPVCECGVVPFARRLMHKGAPPAVAVAALMAVPVLNPIVIASTLAAFGFSSIFWGRIGMTLLVAVITGVLVSTFTRRETILRDDALAPVAAHGTSAGPLNLDTLPMSKPSFKKRARKALVVAVDEFFEMSRFLILGAGLAALLQTFVPRSALLGVGQGTVTSVLAMMGLAVLLSICSTVDAFIALAFTGTFTGGAVLAFLVFGPMVDIKSTLMFLRVFRARTVAVLVLVPFLMTLLGALLWNLAGLGG